jgi:hypothetical protein
VIRENRTIEDGEVCDRESHRGYESGGRRGPFQGSSGVSTLFNIFSIFTPREQNNFSFKFFSFFFTFDHEIGQVEQQVWTPLAPRHIVCYSSRVA